MPDLQGEAHDRLGSFMAIITTLGQVRNRCSVSHLCGAPDLQARRT